LFTLIRIGRGNVESALKNRRIFGECLYHRMTGIPMSEIRIFHQLTRGYTTNSPSFIDLTHW